MTEDNETGNSEDAEPENLWEQFLAEHEEEMEELHERMQSASPEPRMEVAEAAVEQYDDIIIDVSPDLPNDMVIRRYLSIPQFLSVLEGEQLWFNSALNFNDDFEGSLPKVNVQERELTERFSEETIKKTIGESAVEEIRGVEGRVYQDEIHVGHCLLNCWRMGEGPDQYTESALFWNAYVPEGEGVAIESTVGQLKQQLMERGESFKRQRNLYAVPGVSPGVYTGAVRYIDFNNDAALHVLPTRLFYKRDRFTEEREFRAIVDSFEYSQFLQLEECESENFEYKHPPGTYVNIAPRELINEIILAPNAPSHLYSSIKALVERYDGFDASDVKLSSLDRDEPIH